MIFHEIFKNVSLKSVGHWEVPCDIHTQSQIYILMGLGRNFLMQSVISATEPPSLKGTYVSPKMHVGKK